MNKINLSFKEMLTVSTKVMQIIQWNDAIYGNKIYTDPLATAGAENA